MKLQVHTEESLFEYLKPEWNELLKRSTADHIFNTWEWHSTWWDAYHPGNLWVITCRDTNDRLLGIAPWFIDDNRTIRGIGCEDVTDYIDVIVDGNAFESVLNCFCCCLIDHKQDFDTIKICNLLQSSRTSQVFPEILKQHHFNTELHHHEVAPVIQLPEHWEGYFELLDKKSRHELRRKLRRASGAPETIDWYIVGSEHNLNDELERFLELMAASDAEKREFLQNDEHVKFFRNFMPLAYQNGWLQLNFLTIDGIAAAAYLNFDYNNQILVYNSGILREKFDQLSPGLVLLAKNIRYAIENGYELFDFLRGNEPYKYDMGGKDTILYMLSAHLIES